ncbi:MAG: hypothetical protein ACRDU9_04935 [Acidimicrobiia bacterium]
MISPNTDIAIPRWEGIENRTATLVFPRGAANLHVRAGDTEHFTTGTFSGRPPELTSAGSTVYLRYPRGVRRSRGELSLNPAVEWAIESRRGVAEWTADLTGIELARLRIAGGASRLSLNLPRPASRVHIEIEGGADRVEIVRPADIGTVLQIRDGASNLVFDDQQFGAVSGELRLESTNRGQSAGQYQITVRRGVSRMSVITSDRVSSRWKRR